jgi:hypothetical protein
MDINLSIPLTLGVCVFALHCPGAWAGARAVRPGSGSAVLAASHVGAHSVIDRKGDKHPFSIRETSLSTYGELGLTRSLAAGWSWTGVKAVASDSFDAISPGDPEVSLTWHIGSKGAWQFAAQGSAAFPLGADNPASSPDFLYGVFSQGAFAFEARPVLGWSGGGTWLQAGAGPRLRTRDLAPQFHYNLAGGGAIAKRIGWQLAFDGLIPLDTRPSGKPGDQEKFYGYHLGGDYRFFRAWQAGLQFDSMFTLGQELPLGARYNAFVRFAWKG